MPIDKVDINLLYLSKKRLAFEFIIFHSKAVAFVNIALFYDVQPFRICPSSPMISFLVRTLLPVVIAVLLVVFGAKQILVNTLGTAFFFRLHLTIVPCVLMIPILVGIAYVIPKYQFEKMSRESVVERIRKE